MVIFEKNKDKICSKYTKLHRFKKFSRGSMPPNPPSNTHGDMQIPKSEKKILGAPLSNPGDAPDYQHQKQSSLILILVKLFQTVHDSQNFCKCTQKRNKLCSRLSQKKSRNNMPTYFINIF